MNDIKESHIPFIISQLRVHCSKVILYKYQKDDTPAWSKSSPRNQSKHELYHYILSYIRICYETLRSSCKCLVVNTNFKCWLKNNCFYVSCKSVLLNWLYGWLMSTGYWRYFVALSVVIIKLFLKIHLTYCTYNCICKIGSMYFAGCILREIKKIVM